MAQTAKKDVVEEPEVDPLALYVADPRDFEELTPAETAPDGRNPLDIPYSESGLPKPVYYNPIFDGLRYYRHMSDPATGRALLIFKGVVKNGRYLFDTPRQEQYVRDNVSKHLKGNSPDRWKGDNLDEEDRWFCADCQFTTRNTRVATDHRRYRKHQERIPN